MSEHRIDERSAAPEPSKSRLLEILGPGLITGASDDDPSGIATYSQGGAQFGYVTNWTLLLTYPLMVAVQMISARIGRTTGRGLAGSIVRCYPPWVGIAITGPLLVANIINIGADLGAMGDAAHLLLGGYALIYVVAFGTTCILLQVFVKYERYVAFLKWLSLALLSYIATLFVVHIDWASFARGLFIPSFTSGPKYWSVIVAIFGTTISPYLFFWQASQEAEDLKEKPDAEPLIEHPREAKAANERITLDTLIGMAASNIVALAIMTTTAATLNKAGVTNIENSVDAAKAIEPLAGKFAEVIFATGIIGTGLLAVPVLAGSAAYAVSEVAHWKVGLSREPREAKAFYTTVAVATIVGMVLNFTPIQPMTALFWSAVINGVVAVPVMVVLMLIASDQTIMKQFVIGKILKILGWATCLAMCGAVVGMAGTAFL
ncbi:divalent metal cation transporter [Rhizobium sp. NZLR1b]|uniref:NRAMP family divalent metal transporter n=1 Tax=unclassified Rhizobium TaxID=2613769 RepID=UPI00287F6BB3|nr:MULTISPECIES: divalent metal cation transporter [unclassified Rhizobium]MBX5159082.1 divalent metal cation transporter [Rhizobium sp. NZLR8]MBX5174673.1 divalent metal cation transporter [Rhizobium sp. NZLR1b]